MPDDDFDFYSRRLREEQALAATETSPVLEAAHRLLQEIYSERVESIARAKDDRPLFG